MSVNLCERWAEVQVKVTAQLLLWNMFLLQTNDHNSDRTLNLPLVPNPISESSIDFSQLRGLSSVTPLLGRRSINMIIDYLHLMSLDVFAAQQQI